MASRSCPTSSASSRSPSAGARIGASPRSISGSRSPTTSPSAAPEPAVSAEAVAQLENPVDRALESVAVEVAGAQLSQQRAVGASAVAEVAEQQQVGAG